MRQLYKNIYRFILTVSLLVGGVYFFQSCSSYEDDMLGSFPFLDISVNDTSISNITHSIEIPINTNRKWTATVEYTDSDDIEWITTTPSSDYRIMTITIQNNTTGIGRSAIITVKSNNSEQVASFTVEQDAASRKIFNGLLVLKNQEELDNNTYTHVNGAVLVGDLFDIKDVVTKAAGKTVEIQIGDSIYSVGSSNISDLSKLATIRSISEKTLYVLNTQVREIPTDSLINLQLDKLYLDWNEITEIDNIEILQTITELSISNNYISNIDFLSTLKNIQKLNVAGNQIKDVTVLSNMLQITHLILGESADETNQITNISVLNQLSSLERLSLSGLPIDEKQIENISLPPNCIVVKEDLKGSPLPLVTTDEPVLSEGQLLLSGSFELRGEDVTIESYGFYYGTSKSLEQMTFMEATINGNDFTATLGGLEDNKRYYIYAAVKTTEGAALGELKVFGENHFGGDVFISTNNDITNFQNEDYSSITGSIIIGSASEGYSENAIEVQINDTYYYFSKNNEITNISFLADTKQINGGVYIVNTEVSNLTPLTQIDTTPTLWLAKNKIESIPDLSSIQGLTTLNVSMNLIENIENISLLSGLTSLYLGDRNHSQSETNTIKDITPLHNLSNLKVLDISGLAINTPAIDAIRIALPECTIYAEGMSAPQAPQVTTLEASNITAKEAVLKGTIVSQGDASITEYGFYFGTDTSDLEKIVISSPDVSSGSSFEYAVSSLQLNVSYLFKAFATNENGESLGEMMTFKVGNTYEGTVVLRTQEEVNNFPQLGYDKIDGNLIIGNATTEEFEGYKTSVWVNNTYYYFTDSDISNLDSLVRLTDLTQGVYVLYNKNLSDLSPLSQLTSLTRFNCDYNDISDLSPLSQLTNLTSLSFVGNEVSDLSPLSQLTNLTSLSFDGNEVSDLSPLSQLTNLTYLNCSNNDISDLSSLSHLIDLTSFYCYYNEISDLSPLSQLTNLTTLHLEINKISDISALENITSLTWLALSNNSIQNIEPLKKLSNLAQLYLNRLPLTQTQVDELRTSLPNCEIYADNLTEYAPVLGSVSTEILSSTTVNLQAEITNQGVSEITERGFYYGTEDNRESMTKVQADGQGIGTYTYQLSGLSESTTYYVIAYASNASIIAYSETTSSFQTAGMPSVETVQMQSSYSYVEGKVTNSGNTSIISYGVVWSLVGEPTVNSYLGINRVQSDVTVDATWSLELTELQAGYTYNVRCFAENEYGLVYGEVIQHTAPGGLSMYNYTLNSTIPNFEDGTASSINQLYSYSYKLGIANSGEAMAPSSVASNQYVYSLAEGEQSLVFCNLNASSSRYQIESSLSPDMMFKIHQTNGENGIGTDIVIGTDLPTMTADQEKTINFKREVARLNLLIKASAKDGSMVGNISELLSNVDISIDGFYSEVQILSDLNSQKGGSISNLVSSSIDATGYLQTVAENIYTFPTIAGKKNKVDIKVEFRDGRSIKLSSFLPQVIEANKIYSITFTISENKTNNSFTLADIELVEEIIEF